MKIKVNKIALILGLLMVGQCWAPWFSKGKNKIDLGFTKKGLRKENTKLTKQLDRINQKNQKVTAEYLKAQENQSRNPTNFVKKIINTLPKKYYEYKANKLQKKYDIKEVNGKVSSGHYDKKYADTVLKIGNNRKKINLKIETRSLEREIKDLQKEQKSLLKNSAVKAIFKTKNVDLKNSLIKEYLKQGNKDVQQYSENEKKISSLNTELAIQKSKKIGGGVIAEKKGNAEKLIVEYDKKAEALRAKEPTQNEINQKYNEHEQYLKNYDEMVKNFNAKRISPSTFSPKPVIAPRRNSSIKVVKDVTTGASKTDVAPNESEV